MRAAADSYLPELPLRVSTPLDLANGVEIAAPNAMRAAASFCLPGPCKWSGNSCPKCNAHRRECLPPGTLQNGVEIAVPNAMRAAASIDLPGPCKMEWK